MCPPSPKIAGPGFGSSEPFQTRERTSVARLGAAVVTLALLLACTGARADEKARSCEEWHGEFVAVEGTVEIRNGDAWKPVAAGGMVCTGDSVRVGSYSRAAIRLPDRTVLRLDQDTTLTFTAPKDDTATWIDVLKGVIHVISRDPRALKFNTPYANAGLDGTEFVLEVKKDRTDVTVIEGEVKLSNDSGQIGVPSGQRGSATMTQQLEAVPVQEPINALRWTPYFVSILGDELPAPDAAPRAAESSSAEFFARRAASRLKVGQVDSARADVAQALRLDPRCGRAFAVDAMIALSEARVADALAAGHKAVDASPRLPAPELALSYAAEAGFDLDLALASATKATALDGGNALAWARVAELRLATGDFAGARKAAEKSLDLRSQFSYALAVLGFADLRSAGPKAAETTFKKAISSEPSAPLPRLGLALALIRDGNLQLGRDQLELAVMLDPTNASSRSYMAKTYDAELRETLSAAQLDIAKRLNGADPTPWLYDALRKQNDNRPIEALRDLQSAIERNDNHGVYRSRLLMDEDLAARSAGIGQIHRTLGFEELALLEGWKSAAADPGDYSSHRLLADVYSYLPRHEIARVDELYQSQLLQPLNLTPVRPQLGEASSFVLDTQGPSKLAFDEFHALLAENGPSFQGSAVVGAHDTRGIDVAVGALEDKMSYSLGWFDYSTDGFRENNDFHQRIGNALFQFRPAPGTGVLTELRTSRVERGDLMLLFDPSAYSPNLRSFETVNSARVGIRHDVSAHGTFLASVIGEWSDSGLTTDAPFVVDTDRTTLSVDLLHLYRADRWQLTSGGRYSTNHDEQAATTSVPGLPETHVEARSEIKHWNGFLYATLSLTPTLSATFGGSFDDLDDPLLSKSGFNPKLGFMWQPSGATSVRVVAFQTLQGPLLSKQNAPPSLEPTHVVGFNQRFFGTEGEKARRYGAAVDHRFSSDLYTGGEVSLRKLSEPLTVPGLAPFTFLADVRDSSARAYAYWTPSTKLAVSGRFEYEHVDSGGVALPDGFTDVETRRLPLSARYFHPSGFSAGATATWISQSGDFAPMFVGPNLPIEHGEDRFWTLDLSLGYRLPNRRGIVSLDVSNVLDQDFRFQDIDPENPRILPERTVLLRASLSY
ncbi:MAG TPA: FecR domain-containing protein [Gammaproteobacteria bacterium]|nr:FecR domain-containing protein [Gammaproteobacteria bacterium]